MNCHLYTLLSKKVMQSLIVFLFFASSLSAAAGRQRSRSQTVYSLKEFKMPAPQPITKEALEKAFLIVAQNQDFEKLYKLLSYNQKNRWLTKQFFFEAFKTITDKDNFFFQAKLQELLYYYQQQPEKQFFLVYHLLAFLHAAYNLPQAENVKSTCDTLATELFSNETFLAFLDQYLHKESMVLLLEKIFVQSDSPEMIHYCTEKKLIPTTS